MSKAVAVIEPHEFAVLKNANATDALQINLEGERLVAYDLQAIKVPTSGGKVWEIPTLEEDPDLVQSFDAIIVDMRTTRRYYARAFGEGENSGPDCSSPDGKIGVGPMFPGQMCETCTMNQWGSKGKGKACGERRLLFLMLPGNLLPVTLDLPSTAIKPLREYVLKIGGAGVPFYGAVTRFGLKIVQNAAGINFTVPTFSLAPNGRLVEEQVEQMRGLHEIIKTQIQTQGAASRAEGDTVDVSVNLEDDEL